MTNRLNKKCAHYDTKTPLLAVHSAVTFILKSFKAPVFLYTCSEASNSCSALGYTYTFIYIHIVPLLFKSKYTRDIALVGVRFHPLDTQMSHWTASDSNNHSGTCVNLKRTRKR